MIDEGYLYAADLSYVLNYAEFAGCRLSNSIWLCTTFSSSAHVSLLLQVFAFHAFVWYDNVVVVVIRSYPTLWIDHGFCWLTYCMFPESFFQNIFKLWCSFGWGGHSESKKNILDGLFAFYYLNFEKVGYGLFSCFSLCKHASQKIIYRLLCHCWMSICIGVLSSTITRDGHKLIIL